MGANQLSERRDFYISYSSSDQPWAEWIAVQLEQESYTLFLEAWDFRPGMNLILEMDHAAQQAERLLLLLSPAFFQAALPQASWAHAFASDPTGSHQRLLPIRVEPCVIHGLLANIIGIDLVGLEEKQARARLLEGVQQGRVKLEDISFPAQNIPGAHAAFPGSLRDQRRTKREKKETMQTVKALFLAANPVSTNRLAIDEEMRAIEQKVRAADHRDVLVFQSNWAVRPDDLLQLLNQHRPQIVHFSGHGSHAGLSLAGNDGQSRPVTTRALTALFTTLKDNVRLVFLNACYSREQAQAFITSIDCVIGMKEDIHDAAAIVFASSFYRAIGFGRSIQEAFDQGRTALLLEGIADEDIPELLVRDGVDPKQIVLIGSSAPF